MPTSGSVARELRHVCVCACVRTRTRAYGLVLVSFIVLDCVANQSRDLGV